MEKKMETTVMGYVGKQLYCVVMDFEFGFREKLAKPIPIPSPKPNQSCEPSRPAADV